MNKHMVLASHVTAMPYGQNIALWNNLSGCHIVISKETFETFEIKNFEIENITPALTSRLQRFHMIEASIPNLPHMIPHRNRHTIIVDQGLWSPIPEQHHSGGFLYRCINLSEQEQNILKNIDGKKTIENLSSELSMDVNEIYALLLPWMACDMQIIQLRDRSLGPKHSALLQMIAPRRAVQNRPQHMIDEDGATQLQEFHQTEITNAQRHFDDVEITLAHALEKPHPSLQNRSFGFVLAQELCSYLSQKPNVVCELGAGSGAVTEGFYDFYEPNRYIRMDASPVLLEHQKNRVPQSESLEGYAPPIPLPSQSVDLFLCNEVIADLPSSPKTSQKSQELISKFCIDIPPEQHTINTGSWELLESIYKILHPDGIAYLSEFGSVDEIPEETTHLNHPEVSIHFGQLEQVARHIGFETKLLPLDQLLHMSLQELWLSKHSFMALRACFLVKGKHLEARAYHPSTFLSSSDIYGLEWNSMNEPGPAPLPQRIWALLLWKKKHATDPT